MFYNPMSQEIQKWEYKYEKINTIFPEEKLNKLGEEGWEAIGFNSNSWDTALLFKRPKQ